MLIDTHCHLDFDEFNGDRASAIERAGAAGVKYIINIGSSLEGSRRSVKLASEHENIFASVGIHPHHANDVTDAVFAEAEKLFSSKKIVAIGEVGLDYYKSQAPPAAQKEMFIKFISLAKKHSLPIIIHNRDATDDTMDILKGEYGTSFSGVMHCFSGDKAVLKRVLDIGSFISFTCNLTFKKADALRETAKYVPPDRLMLETDAPFLAPQAERGKRNEPAYVTHLRDMLAGLLKLTPEEIERVTTANAVKLFSLDING